MDHSGEAGPAAILAALAERGMRWSASRRSPPAFVQQSDRDQPKMRQEAAGAVRDPATEGIPVSGSMSNQVTAPECSSQT